MYKKMSSSLKVILAVFLLASFFTVACNNEGAKKEAETIDTGGEQKPIPTPNKAADTTAIDTTGEQKPIPTPN